jgi:hypothetical protein
MIQNFGGDIAGEPCADAWVSQFLNRNKHLLTARWTAGMDRNCYKADSKDKYKAYFKLQHNKMREYKVEEENVYNMDEKGFLMGITRRSKRVFPGSFGSKRESLRRSKMGLVNGLLSWLACAQMAKLCLQP